MRKLRNISSLSTWCTDFKNIIFDKFHSPFQGHWGQEVYFWGRRGQLCFSSSFHGFSFRIFFVLGFDENSTFNIIWPQRPQKQHIVEGLRSWSKYSFQAVCLDKKERAWFFYITNQFKASCEIIYALIWLRSKLANEYFGCHLENCAVGTICNSKNHN